MRGHAKNDLGTEWAFVKLFPHGLKVYTETCIFMSWTTCDIEEH